MVLTTPEGEQYTLLYERKFNFAFQTDFKTKLTIIPAHRLLLANIRQALHIYQTQDKGPVAILDFRSRRNNAFNPSALPLPSSQVTFPTCHSYTPDSDDHYDTLVGLSNGEVLILSLAAQTQATGERIANYNNNGRTGAGLADSSVGAMPPVNPIAVPMQHASPSPSPSSPSSLSFPSSTAEQMTAPSSYSSNNNSSSSSSKPSKCVAVSWVPKTAGNLFVAAYQDGTVNVYQKLIGTSTDSSLLSPSSPLSTLGAAGGGGFSTGFKKTPYQHSLQTRIAQLQGPYSSSSSGHPPHSSSKKGTAAGLTTRTTTATVNALAPSPDGRYIAVASQNGVLSIHDARTGSVVTGFKGYYGGLLCCAWSSDGLFVASGGEDDLITMFSVEKQCVVAVCEGHNSWVTSVAFDPSYNNNNNNNTGSSNIQGEDVIYRLLSVSQDCHLALWEVDVTEDVDHGFVNSPTSAAAATVAAAATAGHRRHRSGSDGGSWGGGAAAGTGWPGNDAGMLQSLPPHHRRGGSSASAGAGAGSSGIVEALHQTDMPLVGPLCMLKMGDDPLSDVVFDCGNGEKGFFVAAYSGNIKSWKRMVVEEEEGVSSMDEEE